jgi:hypothetical protein
MHENGPNKILKTPCLNANLIWVISDQRWSSHIEKSRLRSKDEIGQSLHVAAQVSLIEWQRRRPQDEESRWWS